MTKCTKEGVLVNLYLMKIHFLILKLIIIREISSFLTRILH
jgi:hypothetical protein